MLKRAFQKRKGYEQLLEKVEMLKSLEVYERMNLCDALVPKSFTNGSIIIKEVGVLAKWVRREMNFAISRHLRFRAIWVASTRDQLGSDCQALETARRSSSAQLTCGLVDLPVRSLSELESMSASGTDFAIRINKNDHSSTWHTNNLYSLESRAMRLTECTLSKTELWK